VLARGLLFTEVRGRFILGSSKPLMHLAPPSNAQAIAKITHLGDATKRATSLKYPRENKAIRMVGA
jgi:hypothetical protein